MSKIMDAIRRNFDRAHWNYTYEESGRDGDEVIRMGMRTKQLENRRTIVAGRSGVSPAEAIAEAEA